MPDGLRQTFRLAIDAIQRDGIQSFPRHLGRFLDARLGRLRSGLNRRALSFDEMYGRSARRGPWHTAFQPHRVTAHDTKLIAFYLPQFHPIPENDLFWGRGFTEWASTSRAVPQFVGHRQPRLPADLGYYDLRLPGVMHQQVALARNYGLDGFAFHWYWFHGKRVLETPVEDFLADKTLDFPFCLSWANESWTRRWDGAEHEVLIPQTHSADDDVTHIRALIPYFRDPRYIRVQGRPLFLVYNTLKLPDPKATAERWRRICREEGVGEIYLVGTTAWGGQTPLDIGFDAQVQFPPHGFVPPYTRPLRWLNPTWKGHILDYPAMVDLFQKTAAPDFKQFPCAVPDWDNTARLRNNGRLFVNADPGSFQRWMVACIQRAQRTLAPPERMVFINAWNEWAEGAYLEPDFENGYANLEAVHRAREQTQASAPQAESSISVSMPMQEKRVASTVAIGPQ